MHIFSAIQHLFSAKGIYFAQKLGNKMRHARDVNRYLSQRKEKYFARKLENKMRHARDVNHLSPSIFRASDMIRQNTPGILRHADILHFSAQCVPYCCPVCHKA